MDSNGNTSYIEVRDLFLASYLYASNIVSLIGKRRLPTGEVLFRFDPKHKADELISLYWALKAPPIQPKNLFSAQRDLKDMIFGG